MLGGFRIKWSAIGWMMLLALAATWASTLHYDSGSHGQVYYGGPWFIYVHYP
jgi:hypothetical protein